MHLNYTIPANEQDFERVCLIYAKHRWELANLFLYGKKGQKQHGVDIVDMDSPSEGSLVIQSKLKESQKELSSKEIAGDVAKALSFPHKIADLVFITTAKKSTVAQDRIMEINASHRKEGKFSVHLVYWDEVCDAVPRCPDLAEALAPQGLALTKHVIDQSLEPITERLDANSSEAETDKNLALAVQWMNKFDYPAALALLNNLKNTAFDRMTGLQRFRCLTNIATIEMHSGKTSAASLFLDAYREYPQHEKAVANKAAAEAILGDSDEAWKTIKEGLENEPNNINIAAAYIVCAPPSKDTDLLLQSLPLSLREHVQVIEAVAYRLLDQKRYEDAIVWAKKLALHQTEEPEAFQIEARALQLSTQPSDPRDVLKNNKERQKMSQVAGLFERAVVGFEKKGFWLMAIQIRLYQLDAARLTGDIQLFLQVIEAGLQLARSQKHLISESRFLLARSQMNTHKKDYELAYKDAEAAHKLSDALDTHLIYAYALWDRNHQGDRAQAQEEILGIFDKLTGPELEDAADLVVPGFTDCKDWERAEKSLSLAEASGLETSRAKIYRAEIARSKGDLESAKKFALEAKDRMAAITSASTRRQVGRLLCAFDLNMDAVAVLEPLASRDSLSADTRNFLDCLLKTEQDFVFLEWSDALRLAGVKDEKMLNAQVIVLTRYDPEKALKIIEDALLWSSDAPWLRVWRYHLSLRLQLPETTALTLQDVPSIDSVEVDQIYSTVEALKLSGLLQEAVDYAYRCLHRFPKESAAHAALINSMLLVNDDKLKLHAPDEVVPGCVVEYIEEGSSIRTFKIIDDDVPSAFPEIVGTSDPVAKAFLGHEINDEVVLAESYAQDRTAKICGIYNRYTYRLGQSLSSWQLQFPDKPFIWQIKFEKEKDTGQLDIGPMLKILTLHQENLGRLDQLYLAGSMPIGFLAEAMGRHIFDVMAHLAYEEGMFVNCALVSDDRHEKSLTALRDAKGLVLDATGLWTLEALGLVDFLEQVPIPIFISQEVLDALRDKIDSLDGKNGKTLMAKAGDGIGLIEQTAEEVTERRKRWEFIATLVNKKCKIGTSLSLASLDVSKREELSKFTGGCGLHSIAAAKDAGFLVWTDDRMQELVAKDFFQVERVWTQLVLEWLQGQGKLPMVGYHRASAQLEAFRYLGTGLKAETLIEAGRMSDWKSDSSLLKGNLSILGDKGTLARNTLAMALNFVCAVQKEVKLTMKQDILITAVLEQLNKRQDGISLIQGLMNQIPRLMPLDPMGSAHVQDVIRGWLKAKLII